MKKILIILSVLITFTLSYCGNITKKGAGNSISKHEQNGTAELAFKEYEHDFGKVAEGEKIAYVFTFENKGSADLVIASATTSCGCTVPKYDTKPITPGGAGNLEVVFDTSGRNGMQTKTITVKSNAATPVVLLKITAEVVTTIN
jgi:predicted small secreted protein